MRQFALGLLALCCVCALPLPAQQAPSRIDTLYMPRSVHRALARGTRSLDGRPGPNYWQNHARYTIRISTSPPDRVVRGSEEIVYYNNSPDTLRQIVLQELLNIHRPGAPRDGGASPEYLNPGVLIDQFVVNGRRANWREDPRYFTWRPVGLPAPLAPHDSMHVAIDWHYQISEEAGREGMLDSTTYYLAYFYPRIAVYDDYNGWNTMNFTDAQEFYSDFNDFDVTVRVPANFLVWGTGTLQNAPQVLQPDVAQKYQTSLTSDDVIHVATVGDLAARRVTQNAGANDWHFTATNVPDVAFAVSDHYDWDAASVVVDTVTGRRASVQSAFNDTAADFHHMVGFGQHALGWFSRNWPGVPYPYEKSTIVQGSADMEYPMMVNDGSNADTSFSRFVADHEIAHTYFPFYMGINETRYGFMDEGWATTFEYLINVAAMGDSAASSLFKSFRVNGWAHDPSALEDLPIITPEDVLKGVAYGNNAYGKASLGYLAAKDLLGDAAFKTGLHAFMDRWHGKHPLPWDFFNSMNDATGRNVNWFWNNWFFTNYYIDLAVQNVATASGGYAVTIDNVGGMAAPLDLHLVYSDGTTEIVHETPAIWAANPRRATVRVATRKTLQSLSLDGGIWVDADTTNNRWPAAARPPAR